MNLEPVPEFLLSGEPISAEALVRANMEKLTSRRMILSEEIRARTKELDWVLDMSGRMERILLALAPPAAEQPK